MSVVKRLDIGVDAWWHLAVVVVTAVLANMMFAAATQGWFLAKNRIHESALLLVTFTLFRPGFWWDMLYPPYEPVPAARLLQVVEEVPANARLRVHIQGVNILGKEVSKGVLLPLDAPGPASGSSPAATRFR